MQHGELITIRCPWSIERLFRFSYTCISDIFIAGSESTSGIERVRRDPSRDLPEWLEGFTENLVDDSVPEHRDASTSSHELSSESRAEVVSGKHSIYTLYRFEDQNYKGSLQKTHWYSREHFVDFNNRGSQTSHWRMWISTQSSIRGCGTRLGNTVDTIIPMEKQKKLLNKRKIAYKSSWSRRGTTSHIHWQLHRIWQIMWRSSMEPSNVHTSSVWNEWNCREGGKFNHPLEVQTRWTVVGVFYGMLLLFTTCSRLLSGWERSMRTAIWRTFQWANRTFRRFHHFCKNVLSGFLHGLRSISGRKLEKGYLLVADVDELQENDASGVYVKRINAKEVLVPKEDEELFLIRHAQLVLSRWQEQLVKSEDPTEFDKISKRESDTAVIFKASSTTSIRRMGSKTWCLECIWKLHLSLSCPRKTNNFVPHEISFPFPLGFFDVVRRTKTLNVLQECQSDDMDGFHPVHLLEQHSTSRIQSRRRLTKIQATSRPEYVWPEVWSNMSKTSQHKEKQHGAEETPKLDNALELRYLLGRFGRHGIQYNQDKCATEAGIAYGFCNAV